MINILATTARQPGRWLLALLLAGFGLAGCSGGGYSPPPAWTDASLEVVVQNVQFEGISGARVTVSIGGLQREGTTGAQGTVIFGELPVGLATVAIAADGYETGSYLSELALGTQSRDFQLAAIGAWQAGLATVSASEVIDRAADGTSLTFAVEVSIVTGEDPEPLMSLSDADFRLEVFDCGWGGPRDCASDAAGNPTGIGGYYTTDGVARSFELLPAASRRPYIAGILVDVSARFEGWEYLAPALKSYFNTLNGDDVVGLATVAPDNGAATLEILGPFTRDGASYLEAIDQLPQLVAEAIDSADDRLFNVLVGAIEWVAFAAGSEVPSREATLVLVGDAWLALDQMYEVAARARASGVRISTVNPGWLGNSELATRTDGYSAVLNDIRQYGMALGSADSNLSDSAPVYRMQFTVTGERGTFVAGGNVNLHMHINTPSSMVNRGAFAYFSVAIPE